VVFPTVEGPPAIETAPPLIKISPDRSRLTSMVLSRESPVIFRVLEEKLAVTAMVNSWDFFSTPPVDGTIPGFDQQTP
jgi:hypothetical protein